MVLCPPASLLSETGAQIANSGLFLGGQDCHTAASGAFTGDISAAMLKDIGCTYVILGHSERRQYHKEDDALIAAKATAAHAAGLISIICVGETDAERSAGQQNTIVQKQLKNALPAGGCTPENTVIAYEPVWAIGTGKTASTADIAAMHAHIRGLVPAGMKILYGGSVKSSNAAEILSTPNVDGALVGGASLKADEFWAIATAV
jgi:triosephosphate isomerase